MKRLRPTKIAAIIIMTIGIVVMGLAGCSIELGSEHVHTPSEWIIEKESTCAQKGIKYKECTECGEILRKREIEKLPHQYGDEWISDGTYHWHTASCGCVMETASKEEHNWDKGYITVEASCERTGTIVYTCTYCKTHKQEMISGHNYVEMERKEATCTENGYRVLECSTCFAQKIETLDVKEHTLTTSTIIQANCESDGSKSGICDVCGEYVEIRIPATGHNPSELIFEVEEYCDDLQLGSVYCMDCEELLSTFGHSYEKTIKQAACTKDGEITYTCTNCSHSYSTVIPATGHIDGDWVVKSAATCVDEGQEILLCAICEETLDTRTVEKVNHIYKSEQSSDAITYSCKNCSHSYKEEIEKQVYTVTFESNGGSECETLSVQEGSVLELPTPEKENCEFLGWYIDEELENEYENNGVTKAITLYAAWETLTLTATKDNIRIITDATVDYTFKLITEYSLTNANLSRYLSVTDTNDKTVGVYISAQENGVYEISSNHYEMGTTYTVLVVDGVEIEGVSSNEFWFIVTRDNYQNIQYKDDVLLIAESNVYGIQTEEDFTYLMLRSDLLNVGDVAVIYGKDKYDVLAAFSVLVEGMMSGLPVYQIKVADGEEVYEVCQAYYSGVLDISNIEFNADLEEEVETVLLKSPMYAQFSTAAQRLSSTTHNEYTYKLIQIKPTVKFQLKNSTTLKGTIGVTAQFSRINNKTSKTENNFYITLEIGNEMSFSLDSDIKSFNNFSLVLNTTTNTSIKLYASITNDFSSRNAMSYFKELLQKAKDKGIFQELDHSSATSKKEIPLGEVAVPFGIGHAYFRISNVFEFKVVGAIGVELNSISTKQIGFRYASGKTSTIHSSRTDTSFSFYMMAKMEISDTVKLEFGVSFLGIVEAYINTSATLKFSISGIANVSITSGFSVHGSIGAYCEITLELKASAGVRAKITYWLWVWKTIVLFDFSIPIASQTYLLGAWGTNKELPLYFAKQNETYSIELTCGDKVNLDEIIDNKVLVQNFSSLTKSYKELNCSFSIVSDSYGLTIKNDCLAMGNEDGTFSITVKVAYGDIYKYVTLNVTCKHQVSTVWSSDRSYHWYAMNCACETTPEKIAHDWGNGVTTESTCKQEGNVSHTCKVCGYTNTVTLPLATHSYQYVTTKPTCTEQGYTTYTCSGCGDNYVADYTNKLSHSYTDYVSDGNAGCVEDGTKTATCDYGCGTTDTVTDEGSAKGGKHLFVEGVCQSCGLTINSNFIYLIKNGGCGLQTSVIRSAEEFETYVESVSNGFYNYEFSQEFINAYGETYFEKNALVFFSFMSSSGGADKDMYECVSATVEDNVIQICIEKTEGKHCDIVIGGAVVGYTSVCMEIAQEVVTDCTTVETSFKTVGSYYIHSYWNISYDEETHWYQCICGEIDESTVEKHNGGTATCIEKAECEICNQEYGEYGEHDYTNDVCNRCGSGVSKGLEYELSSDGTYYIVKGIGSCTDTELVIPSTYNNLPIKEIGDWAFWYCAHLTSVVIPDSVTSIGDVAFEDCVRLTSVTIGNGVTSIGHWAFFSCYNLTKITVGKNNTTYKDIDGNLYSKDGTTLIQYAIGKTDKSFVIPDGVTSIGGDAFSECDSLTSVTIGNSVTSIGDSAFIYCSSLTSVTIGKSVTSIGDIAFHSCYSLTKITVEENNTTYKDIDGNLYSKDGTTLIQYAIGKTDKSFVIPDSVTSIGHWAFYGCNSLTSVTIGNNITSIEEYAFYECDGLTSVTIGNSVTSIGEYAFGYCDSLTSVAIPDSITSIGRCAFKYCDSLTSVMIGNSATSIGNSVTSIGNGAFSDCSSLTSVTIGNNVNSIGDEVFKYCDSLTSVTIGNSVTSIGHWAFFSCNSLTKITVEENNTRYKDIEGNLYSKDGTTLIQYAIGKTDKSFVIPDSVTSIGKYAFSYCSSLTNVTIGNIVTSIGEYAFYECDGLTSVTIGNSVDSIGNGAFSDCSSLTSVTFKNTSGWYVSLDFQAISGKELSETDLAKVETAATYLNSTYFYYYWFRNEE